MTDPIYLPLDGILQIPNLSSMGILGTKPNYFLKWQLLLWISKLNKYLLNKTLPGAIHSAMSG